MIIFDDLDDDVEGMLKETLVEGPVFPIYVFISMYDPYDNTLLFLLPSE